MAAFIMLTSSIHLTSGGQTLVIQGKRVPVNFCVSQPVMELYNRINEYRQIYDLPPVHLSKSLCYVASLHAKDLSLHHPDKGPCNFHSWSGQSFWKPFCYPKDENKKSSVWDKPRELTTYPSRAYEIVYWENAPLVTDTVFMVWKTETYFNSFLLNSGKWQGKPWNAIGISVYENYACAWFGEVPDPEGDAWACGSKPPVPAKDTLKRLVRDTLRHSVKDTLKHTAIIKKTRPAKVKPVKTDSVAVKPADTLARVPAEPAVRNDTAVKTYYIIVKTNLTMETAAKLVNSLKEKDYPGAKVITKDDKIRVSVFESSSKPEVMAKLKEVKKTYRDAWLYKN